MKITLDGGWSIIDDVSCYIIQHESGRDKNNNPIFDYMAYPSTLSQAIQIYVRKRVTETSEVVTLTEYVNRVEKLMKSIKESIDLRTK